VLTPDRLLTGLHDACAAFPDKQKGAGDYSMADIGLSAVSLFFMQSESFLSSHESSKALERNPLFDDRPWKFNFCGRPLSINRESTMIARSQLKATSSTGC
jgi:hypothetical protein